MDFDGINEDVQDGFQALVDGREEEENPWSLSETPERWWNWKKGYDSALEYFYV